MLKTQEIQKVPFHGSSMDPIFKNADFVWIDFAKIEKPKVGDVIAYQDKQKEFICHRLLAVDDEVFFLKGDNSLSGEQISSISLWGRVVAFEKQGAVHHLKNHRLLLAPYSCGQMYFQTKKSIFGRRIARKIGRIYLRIVKNLIAK